MNYEYQPTCQIPPAALDTIYTEAFGPGCDDGTLVEIGAHDGLFCCSRWMAWRHAAPSGARIGEQWNWAWETGVPPATQPG
jgi:hypothetical protein